MMYLDKAMPPKSVGAVQSIMTLEPTIEVVGEAGWDGAVAVVIASWSDGLL